MDTHTHAPVVSSCHNRESPQCQLCLVIGCTTLHFSSVLMLLYLPQLASHLQLSKKVLHSFVSLHQVHTFDRQLASL